MPVSRAMGVITRFPIPIPEPDLTDTRHRDTMTNDTFRNDPSISAGDPDLAWETFHENSKISMFDIPPSDHEVLAKMAEFEESLSFDGYPIVDLPELPAPPVIPLGEAILKRSTAKQMIPRPISLQSVATLLYCAYGITRDQRALGFPRSFRTVPSAGALYPLELYFHCGHAEAFRAASTITILLRIISACSWTATSRRKSLPCLCSRA